MISRVEHVDVKACTQDGKKYVESESYSVTWAIGQSQRKAPVLAPSHVSIEI